MQPASLKWAEKACAYVRSNRGFGSANKRRLDVAGGNGATPKTDRATRLKEAEERDKVLKVAVPLVNMLWNNLGQIRIAGNQLREKSQRENTEALALKAFKQTVSVLSTTQDQPRTLDNKARALLKLSQELKTGTCEDYATAAYVYLLDNDVRPIATATLLGADHAFAVLGKECEPDDVFHKPPEKWGDNVFICDPWANIACLAKHYRIEWTMKMCKWAINGKEIAVGEHWINPLQEDWILAIPRSSVEIRFAAKS